MIPGNVIISKLQTNMFQPFPEEAGPFRITILLGGGKNIVPKEPKHEDIIVRYLRTATLKQPDHSDVIIVRILDCRENALFRRKDLQ